MRRGRLRLPEASGAPDGEHEPLVGHLEQLRTRSRVMKEALFQLEKHKVKRREKLCIGKVATR